MTGNRNPLHYDKAAVTALAFGEIIVPDGVTSGILNAVAAEDLPVRCKSYSFNVDLSFRSPVRPGDFAPASFSRSARRYNYHVAGDGRPRGRDSGISQPSQWRVPRTHLC
jgi:acyl dehydratase